MIYEDFGYKINEDNGITITNYAGKETDITIPAEIDGKPVTEIGCCAFQDYSFLTSIVIPESVTWIGDYAFYGCKSVTSVELPKDVTEIGDKAFYDCSSLTSIVIPDGVTMIGLSVFSGCTSLTSVVIPEGVTKIGHRAFYGCSSLTSVVIPEGVTEIGDRAFRGCSSLTSVVIPESVTKIGGDAFRDCSSLTPMNIPEGVSEIPIDTSQSVKKKKPHSFFSKLRKESSESSNSQTLSDFHHTNTALCWISVPFAFLMSVGSIVMTIVLFKHISETGPLVILGLLGLPWLSYFLIKQELFPLQMWINKDGIECNKVPGCFVQWKDISNMEFEITNMTLLLIPVITAVAVKLTTRNHGKYRLVLRFYSESEAIQSVKKLDQLRTLNLISGMFSQTEVGSDQGTATQNKSRSFVQHVDRVREWFYIIITIGLGLALGLFTGSDKKHGVKYPQKETESQTRQFAEGNLKYESNDTGLTLLGVVNPTGDIIIPSEINGKPITKIGSSAFSRCSSLKSVVIHEGVTEIGEGAFFGCHSLTSVVIPEGVTKIGYSAFSRCSSLTSVVIPEGVTEVGSSAFSACSSLTSVVIPGSVTEIESSTFCGCDFLTFVVIPKGVTKIRNYAFLACSSLTSVEIPESVKWIGVDAFKNCPNLTIHAPKGSEAEQHARGRNIPFEELKPEEK